MRSAEKDPGKAARRSRSIAARFTVFVCVLLLVVGATAVLVLRGETERQSREHVRGIMREVGAAYAPRFAAYVSAGGQTDRRPLDVFMEMPFVTEVNLTDAAGIRIASRTRPGAALDGERLVLPLTHEGARVGTLSFTVARQRLVAGDPFSFWLPFALLAAVVLAAIPLTAIMVRRAMTPLRQLTAFAEGVAASRLAERIEIRTGDEFETLAGAFNHMMARLDASVRRIQRLAFVDPVTELPNADRLQRDLRAAIAAAAQEGTPGALFLLQLERLHKAGETLGKEAAHDLVNATALRLASAVKAADPWAEAGAVACARAPMLARLAGDEFAILFPSLPRGVELRGLANALMQPFEQPFEWREHRVSFSCHLGAAFFPRDGRDAEEVMRHARLALNAAGENSLRMRFFTRSLDRAAAARLNLEKEMRAALEQNQFRAYFQPKVNLRTGRIAGAEALARWVRPDRSVISPGKFIPAAEKMGLIGPISEAVLRDACWKAAAWSREGLPAQVAVNVSVLQFADDSFPNKVLKILEQAGLPPQCLELEITESVAMEDIDRATALIEPLRARGVRFTIDDFGTGHSSLAALTRLPFEVLKIDQTFIRGLSADRHAPAIVETILAMAASLNYDAIAEGVETEEEAEFLRRRGCPAAQGFLFSAAVAPADYSRLLRNGVIPLSRAAASALDPVE